MDEDQRASIVGRIVALEMMMLNMLAIAVSNSPKPITELRTMKHDMFSTFQNAERDIGPFSDLAWEHAIAALDELFENAEKRLSSLYPE